MKPRIYLVGIVALVLTTAAALWAILPATDTAAAVDSSHAGHEHGQAAESGSHANHDEELNAHSDDGEDAADTNHDEHAGHGHPEETAAHADEGDEHAGHDHADHAHAGEGGACPEHRVPEARDALCHGDHLEELQPGEGMLVRLASPEAAARAGIQVRDTGSTSLAEGLAIPGRVEYDRTRLAQITPMAAGVVRRVSVLPGAQVEKGAVLAELSIPEVALLKGELLAARARRDVAQTAYAREEDLLARGISSRQEFQQAEAEYREARSSEVRYRQQLMNFGLAESELQRLLEQGDGSALTLLRAPFAGTIVKVEAAVGEAVSPGSPLLTLARLDTLWVELSVPESRSYQAVTGAPIEARFEGLPGETFSGRLFHVGAELDPRTRTLRALAELQNPERRLKVGMFGRVHLLVEGDGERRAAVPADALQTIDGRTYVFVREAPDLFELRRVEAGMKTAGLVPILAGLSPGEPVVTSQGFALKSEVLKARLGASCADH